MASRERETYQIDPRTYVFFMFELFDECRIILKTYYCLKKYVLSCKHSIHPIKVAANNIYFFKH